MNEAEQDIKILSSIEGSRCTRQQPHKGFVGLREGLRDIDDYVVRRVDNIICLKL